MVWAIIIYIVATGQQFNVELPHDIVQSRQQCLELDIAMTQRLTFSGLLTGTDYASSCQRIPRRVKI